MSSENECQRNSNTTHRSTIFNGYNTPFSIQAPSVFATFICAKEKVTISKEEELTFWGQGYFQIKKNVALRGHRAVFLVYVSLDEFVGLGLAKK